MQSSLWIRDLTCLVNDLVSPLDLSKRFRELDSFHSMMILCFPSKEESAKLELLDMSLGLTTPADGC